MRYTIKDIAAAAHVSVSTVSKCLNSYGDVSPETKRMVLETIERMQYVPNTFARYISQHATHVIGLTVPDITDPYSAQSNRGIETRLREYGYDLFIGNLNRDEERFLQFIKKAREMRFYGLIITPDGWSERILKAISTLDIPVLSIRRRPPALCKVHFIDGDHYAGAMAMLEYLYRHGHRRIAHLRLPNEAGCYRFQAYLDFCAKYQLESRVVCSSIPASILSDAVKNGKECYRQIACRWPDTTALFCGSDFIAIGAMVGLWEEGKLVPGEMSVVGVGNVEMASLPWFGLTTMELFRYEMGVKAADLLMDLVSGREIEDVLSPMMVVERTSVCTL